MLIFDFMMLDVYDLTEVFDVD